MPRDLSFCHTRPVSERVLGVLAGKDMPPSQLQAWASSATALYAADSASDALIAAGFSPTIVGDLDSIDPSIDLSKHRVVKDIDPDRTDCDKLLATVTDDGHTEATIIGLEGDLFDHMLASLSSMAASRLNLRIALRRGFGHLLRAGDEKKVPDAFGRRVSLIPLVRSTGVELTGVLWELSDAIIEPGGFLSVSNEGTGEVLASLRTGVAILFIEGPEENNPSW